jgi:hypothetical protein
MAGFGGGCGLGGWRRCECVGDDLQLCCPSIGTGPGLNGRFGVGSYQSAIVWSLHDSCHSGSDPIVAVRGAFAAARNLPFVRLPTDGRAGAGSGSSVFGAVKIDNGRSASKIRCHELPQADVAADSRSSRAMSIQEDPPYGSHRRNPARHRGRAQAGSPPSG